MWNVGRGSGAMLSLILLITAGLVTSSSAVSQPPWSADRAGGSKFEVRLVLQISAGILALGAVVLAVNVQLGVFQ